MADVFLSYARADSREFVARLSAALQERGKDPWVDLDDIPPASHWTEDLRTGISESDAFCFVISPASIASTHCRTELDHAVAQGKRILPVLHLAAADAEVPEDVGSRNWIPQTGRFTDDFDAALDTLVVAIETDLDWVREHTRWGLRSEEWVRRGEDRSVLARGSDLDQAEAFLSGGAGHEPPSTELQGRYVLASRQAASRRQRQVVTGVSVALALTLVLAVLALLQRNTAVEQRKEAVAQRAAATSRALAANAFLTLPTDPELSVLLGLKAAAASPTQQAEDALRSGILDDRLRARLDHDDVVTSASYSPDGKRIVTTSEDGTAALWNAETGDRIAVLAGHDQPPGEARWSADGSRVATVAQDSTARIWDGVTGEAITTITDPDDPRLNDVLLSADGSVAITSGFVHNRVHFWNATDGSLLGTIPRKNVDRMALSPDNTLLLLAVQGEGVELWSTADATLVASYPDDAQSFFTAAAFSPDGTLFATAGGDGKARVRDVDGDIVADVRHNGTVTDLAFSPNGALLATSSADGTAKVTDLSDGASLSTFAGHEGSVRTVGFSADSTLVASAGDDGRIEEWLPGSGALAVELAGHEGPVDSVEFSPVSDRLVSASEDRTARIWTASPSGGAFERQQSLPLGRGTPEVFSRDGAHALYEGESGNQGQSRLAVMDLGSGVSQPGFVLTNKELLLPALSAQGDLVVTASSSFDVAGAQVRRLSDGSVVSDVPAPAPVAAGFDEDARRVVVAGREGSAAIYDVDSGAQLVQLVGHDPALEVTSAVFSRDGTRVVTAGEDGTARVWDASTGKLIATLAAHGPVPPQNLPTTYSAFSPDGALVVTAAIFEDYATLWNVRTGERIARLDGLGAGATDVAFSPSGRFLLTSDYNGNIRLWDGHDGRLMSLVTDQPGASFGISFNADENRLEVMSATDLGSAAPNVVDVYDCDVCGGLDTLVKLGETRVTRDLTATEESTYLVGGSG